MTNEPLTFDHFLSLENMFKQKPNTLQIRQAYISVSSFILNKKHINIAKVINYQEILNIMNELEADANFESDNNENRRYQLYALSRFSDYIKYMHS